MSPSPTLPDADPGSSWFDPLDPLTCPPLAPAGGADPPAGERSPLPPWANPDDPDYDSLLALGWPPSDPPPHAGPERKAWDETLRLLTAAASALLAARPAYLSTTALAARLGISVGTVRRWVRQGKVTAVKRGEAAQARLFVPISEVDRLAAGRPPGVRPARPSVPRR